MTRIKEQALSAPLQRTRALLATSIGAISIALGAQMALYLPGNPVPVTLQVFAVVGCGILLGSRLGMLAVIQYLMMGLCGLPVFSGLTAGMKSVLGPTGGYLIGFVIAAGLAGMLSEKSKTKDLRTLAFAGLMAVGAIHLTGAAWLRVWLAATGAGSPALSAWVLGSAPFVLLDTAKVFAAATVLSRKR